MSFSKKDRSDYKEGRRDRKRGVVEQAVRDIFAIHPGSRPYYKGRKGEQLDNGRGGKKK